MSDMRQAEERLQALRRELDEAVQTAAKRRRLLTLIMACLAVLMAGYLTFAYMEIAKVDADTVVVLAEQQAAPILDRSAAVWAEDLKAQAPAVIDQAGEAALTIPAALSTQLEQLIDRKIEEEMPKLEMQFKELVAALLVEIDRHAQEGMSDGELSDEEAKALLTLVADQFAESTNREIDKVYMRYVDISSEMLAYLELLATGGDLLTEEQQLHRDILLSFLALMEKVQANDTSPVLLP